jgi:hypothetical protein
MIFSLSASPCGALGGGIASGERGFISQPDRAQPGAGGEHRHRLAVTHAPQPLDQLAEAGGILGLAVLRSHALPELPQLAERQALDHAIGHAFCALFADARFHQRALDLPGDHRIGEAAEQRPACEHRQHHDPQQQLLHGVRDLFAVAPPGSRKPVPTFRREA